MAGYIRSFSPPVGSHRTDVEGRKTNKLEITSAEDAEYSPSDLWPLKVKGVND